jgi:hypothetical protein
LPDETATGRTQIRGESPGQSTLWKIERRDIVKSQPVVLDEMPERRSRSRRTAAKVLRMSQRSTMDRMPANDFVGRHARHGAFGGVNRVEEVSYAQIA